MSTGQTKVNTDLQSFAAQTAASRVCAHGEPQEFFLRRAPKLETRRFRLRRKKEREEEGGEEALRLAAQGGGNTAATSSRPHLSWAGEQSPRSAGPRAPQTTAGTRLHAVCLPARRCCKTGGGAGAERLRRGSLTLVVCPHHFSRRCPVRVRPRVFAPRGATAAPHQLTAALFTAQRFRAYVNRWPRAGGQERPRCPRHPPQGTQGRMTAQIRCRARRGAANSAAGMRLAGSWVWTQPSSGASACGGAGPLAVRRTRVRRQ
jgi:hypothetical protein